MQTLLILKTLGEVALMAKAFGLDRAVRRAVLASGMAPVALRWAAWAVAAIRRAR